jgi:hypothetical protein
MDRLPGDIEIRKLDLRLDTSNSRLTLNLLIRLIDSHVVANTRRFMESGEPNSD